MRVVSSNFAAHASVGNKMGKMHFIILVCLSLSACWLRAEQELPTAEKGKRLANELSQKLNTLGSFQAEYQAVSHDKHAGDITVLFNNYQKYCLIKATTVVRNEPDICYVLDFSKLNDKSGSVKMLIVSGKDGKQYEFSIKYLIDHLDNPIGVLSFMSRQFQLETKAKTDMTSLQAGGPNLSLGLDSTNIIMGAGFSYESTNLMVSWLDPNTITTAINIVETPESVQFSYPDNHVVLVERETGLLLKDFVPDPAKPGSRKIVLQSHSALQNPVPYASIIPEFDKIKFEELPSKLFSEQMCVSYLTELGRQLATMDHFDEMLQTNSAKIVNAARETARQMVREDAKARVDKKSAVEFRNKVLIPAYKSYLQNPPVDIKDLSFSNLLDMTIVLAETNSSILVPSEGLALIEKTKKDSRNIINKLPIDAQEPLIKLYDVITPALIEGTMSEDFIANIEEIKTLGIPEFNSDEGDAYGKRGSREQKNGDLVGAIADFEKALELKPGDVAIKKELLKVKAQMNKAAVPN
jgi:hypothetical protein